ncbi:galactose oxidase [Obba rivulosa]|uniref:Galactose oxidase n=1 Tax=Obba rivulosa TaxID=1052685 RepID=A0A8E2AP94_9APHY|nr:galactose oxidase [Obba rivulosa]
MKPQYLWSQHHLVLQSPVGPQRRHAVSPPEPSLPLLPRYGHSLPVTGTATGELLLFGGLVQDTLSDDVYILSLQDLSATPLLTTGEIPSPRVGHRSALVGRVLIVWGGDTKTSENYASEDETDNGLYLLNLVSREWTHVATSGPAPVGRYGHAVTAIGSKLYMFGGQNNRDFLHDLWVFDLNTLRTRARWELVEPAARSSLPAKRTGHICVTHGDKIYLFGGTDSVHHYNDTWVFDTASGTWAEAVCVGDILSPREGHAAALVDGVIYVFGGRGSDGKDLGDLASLRIEDHRWFMFQNIGPTPSARSGHAITSTESRILVFGGESFGSATPEDNTIHVLNK